MENKYKLVAFLLILGFAAILWGIAMSVINEPEEDLSEQGKEEWEKENRNAATLCGGAGGLLIFIALLVFLFVPDKKSPEKSSQLTSIATNESQQPSSETIEDQQSSPETIESKVDTILQKKSMPKFCPECGTERGSVNFCPNCGYKF